MTAENPTLPFCLKNLDLDCRENCPLKPFARDTVSELADRTGVTYEQAISEARAMTQADKDQMNRMNSGLLALTGSSERCRRSDEV